MTLRQLDLNLLFVLDALVKERSVTRGAKRVGLTQPAMSHAIARLRDALGDELFERRGRALVLTSKARALGPVVAHILEELEAGLFGSNAFDPSRADAILGVAMSEHWHFVLLPALYERLEAEAPGVRLRMSSPSEHVLSEELVAGRVDVALYLAHVARPGLRSVDLVEDGYALVTRRGNAKARRRLTLAEYARCRHVLVGPRGPWADRVERALEAQGLPFSRVLEGVHLQAALEIVSRSEAVLVLPRRLALESCRRWSLQILAPPVDLGTFTLALYWHERTEHDPLLSWFRGLLGEMVRATYAQAPERK